MRRLLLFSLKGIKVLTPGNFPYDLFTRLKTLGKKSSVSHYGEKKNPRYTFHHSQKENLSVHKCRGVQRNWLSERLNHKHRDSIPEGGVTLYLPYPQIFLVMCCLPSVETNTEYV